MIKNFYLDKLNGWQWLKKCIKCGKLFWTPVLFNRICLECKYKNHKIFKEKIKCNDLWKELIDFKTWLWHRYDFPIASRYVDEFIKEKSISNKIQKKL